MALRAKKPDKDTAPRRLKFFLYGPPNWGKTLSCIKLFSEVGPYVLIDTERGAELYKDHIRETGGALLQTSDVGEIRDELKALLSEKHEYRSLIIDPVTKLYESLQHVWTERFKEKWIRDGKAQNAEMEDFGPGYWQRVKTDHKRMMDLVAKLDMNVGMTAHEKPEYEPGTILKKIGTTFDAIRGLDYFFDTIFRGEFDGEQRVVLTEKERGIPGTTKFPRVWRWDPAQIIEWWGPTDLTREAQAVALVGSEDLAEFRRLLEVVKVPEEVQAKWKKAADCEEWSEFPAAVISKCIAWMQAQVKGGEHANG